MPEVMTRIYLAARSKALPRYLALAVFGKVAIGAEQLKAGGVAVRSRPVEGSNNLWIRSSRFTSIEVGMVKFQMQRVVIAAKRAAATVGSNRIEGDSLPPLAISLPSTLSVLGAALSVVSALTFLPPRFLFRDFSRGQSLRFDIGESVVLTHIFEARFPNVGTLRALAHALPNVGTPVVLTHVLFSALHQCPLLCAKVYLAVNYSKKGAR